MATMSKRHQARNEKTLQDLIRTVPGNDRCVDCGARNPGWASWNLGIFLCMRCASLHRKLGTHISKVKSLSMDSWTNEQVDNMKLNGNTNANKKYNPQNAKPQIPLDVDEVDAVLERFIKQKYDQQVFSGGDTRQAMRNNTGTTGSTRSSEDQPPPLPPKPGKRFGFGFRSASAALPSSTTATRPSPRSPDEFAVPPSPMRINKQSRVFGASVGGSGDDIDSKMNQLREMGFTDEKRALSILKGNGGNLERTIESLVRLGEGGGPIQRSQTPLHTRSTTPSQSHVPTSRPTGSTNDITMSNTAPASRTNTGSTGRPSGYDSAPPTARTVPGASPTAPNNPFFAPNLQQPPNAPPQLDQAFQNMQISQQPLFPNATGGYPSQPPLAQDLHAQTMTPPIPQLPQRYTPSIPFQPTSSPISNHNPFLNASSPQPSFPPSNPYQSAQQAQNSVSPFNPFQQQSQPFPQPQSNDFVTSSPQTLSPQLPPTGFQQAVPPSGQQYPGVQMHSPQNNPFLPPQHSFTDPVQYQQQPQRQQPPQSFFQPAAMPVQPQRTGRIDKSSILALYNYPQLAPPRIPEEVPTSLSAEHPNPPSDQQGNPPQMPSSSPQANKRSVTMPAQPMSGSRNPFHTMASNPANTGSGGVASGPSGHVSQESVDVGGYQNGRHSPDAFASLSARFLR